MPRIQILELPEGAADDRPSFVLVIDQYGPYRHITGPEGSGWSGPFDGIAEQLGARAVLVFEGTVEIPANQVTLDDGRTVALKVEADLTAFKEQVAQAAAEAQRRLAGVRFCDEHDGPCFPDPTAVCPAHGSQQCTLCHRNPGSCANDYGACGFWLSTGMHWDTCPNRMRGQ